MRTMTPTTLVVLLVTLLTVRAGVAHAAPIYSIGNGTPGTEFFIQGQSFTPSVAGNDGAGTPSAGEGGAVRLLTFSFDVVGSFEIPTELRIFASEPTVENAASGVGSLGTGAHVGGGVYDFGPGVTLDFGTKYFAVLPFSTTIFDSAGNPYSGGVDMFPTPQGAPTHVTEGFGDFDAGFNATFQAVPEPSCLALMAIVAAAVRLDRTRRRRK